MKLKTILREASIPETRFPECSEIDVVLYDENDEICTTDDVKFIKPLFEDNPDSLEKFILFIEDLNLKPVYSSINILITKHHVIIHYKTPFYKTFRRTCTLDPF